MAVPAGRWASFSGDRVLGASSSSSRAARWMLLFPSGETVQISLSYIRSSHLSSEAGGIPLPLKSRELAFHHFCVPLVALLTLLKHIDPSASSYPLSMSACNLGRGAPSAIRTNTLKDAPRGYATKSACADSPPLLAERLRVAPPSLAAHRWRKAAPKDAPREGRASTKPAYAG